MDKRPGATPSAKEELETSEQYELSRLLASARVEGEADVFAGKRRWPRFRCGIRLEVALGDPDSSEVLQVIMHDISANGCGFWSKESLPSATKIFIREWSHREPAKWLRAVVTRSTLGIAGHRIGVVFIGAAPADLAHAAQEATRDPVESSSVVVDSKERPRSSLRIKCAGASVAASLLATLMGTAICAHLWPNVSWVWVTLVVSALAVSLAGLLVWVDLRAYHRFLESLQAGVQALARGKPARLPPAAAPSPELGRLRQALTELQLVWHEQKEQDHRTRQKLEDLNFLKTNILNMVSHDLRTPLTSILLYAKMLEDELTQLAVDEQRRFLNIISEECTRLSHLVDDLLDAQRLEADRVQWKMEPLDLSDTIRTCGQALEAMAEEKSIDLEVDCDDALPPVTADADKITQVLSNLVSNALKYTPSGGRVRVWARPDGNDVLICVSDDGPGIPRDQWDQIFDRFVQMPTSYVHQLSGVGLGLNIVRQIVDRHGGRVWVESEVGRGSSFYVALPTDASTMSSEPAKEVSTASPRVLVCDPDPELVDRIRQILRRESFDVRVAYSGCRLLALLEQGNTDVVVTDILLPDMDATDLLNAINQGGRREFALVVHSYAGEGHNLRQRGVDIFLGRPARREDILQAVKLAFRRKKGAGRAVLVVSSRSIGRDLQSSLLNAGHTPILAGTTTDAAEKLRNCPADMVIFASDALAPDWSDLPELQRCMDDRTRVVVMCRRIGRSERKRAERHGVEVVQYRPGKASEVLAAIPDLIPDSVQEVAT